MLSHVLYSKVVPLALTIISVKVRPELQIIDIFTHLNSFAQIATLKPGLENECVVLLTRVVNLFQFVVILGHFLIDMSSILLTNQVGNVQLLILLLYRLAMCKSTVIYYPMLVFVKQSIFFVIPFGVDDSTIQFEHAVEVI